MAPLREGPLLVDDGDGVDLRQGWRTGEGDRPEPEGWRAHQSGHQREDGGDGQQQERGGLISGKPRPLGRGGRSPAIVRPRCGKAPYRRPPDTARM